MSIGSIRPCGVWTNSLPKCATSSSVSGNGLGKLFWWKVEILLIGEMAFEGKESVVVDWANGCAEEEASVAIGAASADVIESHEHKINVPNSPNNLGG